MKEKIDGIFHRSAPIENKLNWTLDMNPCVFFNWFNSCPLQWQINLTFLYCINTEIFTKQDRIVKNLEICQCVFYSNKSDLSYPAVVRVVILFNNYSCVSWIYHSTAASTVEFPSAMASWHPSKSKPNDINVATRVSTS